MGIVVSEVRPWHRGKGYLRELPRPSSIIQASSIHESEIIASFIHSSILARLLSCLVVPSPEPPR
jgi:hypothetical protein